jgi:hypothetical protein
MALHTRDPEPAALYAPSRVTFVKKQRKMIRKLDRQRLEKVETHYELCLRHPETQKRLQGPMFMNKLIPQTAMSETEARSMRDVGNSVVS